MNNSVSVTPRHSIGRHTAWFIGPSNGRFLCFLPSCGHVGAGTCTSRDKIDGPARAVP